jgi:hypothetical protein
VKLFAAIAILIVPSPAAAAPTPPAPCITPAELSDMALYFLPVVLGVVTEKCRPVLPAEAYLLTDGVAFAERLSAERSSRWPGARAAFVKLAGEVPAGTTDEQLRQMGDAMFRTRLPNDIRTADCGTVDEFARVLAPLPPDNLGRLAGLLASAGASRDRKKRRPGGFPICPPDAP